MDSFTWELFQTISATVLSCGKYLILLDMTKNTKM